MASLCALPHSKPWGVSLYAVRLQEPGVKLHVITIVFSPSQVLLSAMILMISKRGRAKRVDAACEICSRRRKQIPVWQMTRYRRGESIDELSHPQLQGSNAYINQTGESPKLGAKRTSRITTTRVTGEDGGHALTGEGEVHGQGTSAAFYCGDVESAYTIHVNTTLSDINLAVLHTSSTTSTYISLFIFSHHHCQ